MKDNILCKYFQGEQIARSRLNDTRQLNKSTKVEILPICFHRTPQRVAYDSVDTPVRATK